MRLTELGWEGYTWGCREHYVGIFRLENGRLSCLVCPNLNTWIILQWLTPDHFGRQRKSSGSQRVKAGHLCEQTSAKHGGLLWVYYCDKLKTEVHKLSQERAKRTTTLKLSGGKIESIPAVQNSLDLKILWSHTISIKPGLQISFIHFVCLMKVNHLLVFELRLIQLWIGGHVVLADISSEKTRMIHFQLQQNKKWGLPYFTE